MKRYFSLLGVLLGLCLWNVVVQASDGKKLFKNKCRICHGISREINGPALKDVAARIGDSVLLYAWIRNNKKVLQEGHPYFTALFEKYNRQPMNVFEDLTDEDITSILAYIQQTAQEEEIAKEADIGERRVGGMFWWLVLAGGILMGLLWVLRSRKKNIE